MIDISVIIPTWNRCARLAITLDAIGRCRVPPGLRWEVIVVANGCTDATATVAATHATKLPLVYLEEPRPGVCRARNAGAARARGQLLIFADDDVRPCPDWLGVYWSAYAEHGERHYLFGRLRSEFEGAAPDQALLRIAPFPVRGLDLGATSRVIDTNTGFAEANWACPAHALQTAGGFNPDLGLDSSLGRRRCGESVDLAARLHALGLRGVYLSEAVVQHFVPPEKCTLRHIGEAQHARGEAYAAGIRPPDFLATLPWLMARLGDQLPRRFEALQALTLAVRLWLAWATQRLVGQPGYEAYVSLQFCLGMIRQHLEILRGGQRHPP